MKPELRPHRPHPHPSPAEAYEDPQLQPYVVVPSWLLLVVAVLLFIIIVVLFFVAVIEVVAQPFPPSSRNDSSMVARAGGPALMGSPASLYCTVEQLVARQTHYLEVVGSSPTGAPNSGRAHGAQGDMATGFTSLMKQARPRLCPHLGRPFVERFDSAVWTAMATPAWGKPKAAGKGSIHFI